MEDIDHIETRWSGLAEVLRMAGPIALGSMSWSIMGFVDQVMIAKLGKEALAAAGPAGIWSFTLATFFMGTVGCVATFVAQSIGRGRPSDCGRYAWQGIYLSLGAGLVALALWPVSDSFFVFMGHGAEVARLETIYFKIRLFSYIFIAWQMALSSFFQAIGRPMIATWASIAGNVVNILLDYLLIFGPWIFPAWGIAGAAVATVVALLVQTLMLQTIFMRPGMDRRYNTRGGWRLDGTKLAELFRIGWPAGATHFLDVANWAIFIGFIVGRLGETVLAANNAALNFMSLCFIPALAINQAIAPIVGVWIGRARFDMVKARTYTALKVNMVYMSLMGIVLAVFAKPLIKIFFSDDPEVLRLGHTLIIMAAFFQLFDAVNITVSGALRGAGDTRWMAWVAFIGAYVVFLPCATTLAHVLGLGALGAWMGAMVYIASLSGVYLFRFRRERWHDIRIFSADPV